MSGGRGPNGELATVAAALRRRLFARRLVRGLVRGLLVGAVLAIGALLVERGLLPRAPPDAVWGWLAAILGGAVAVGAATSLRRAPAPGLLLALADRRAGSRELMLTAWEIEQGLWETRDLVEGAELLARARAIAATTRPADVLPLELPREGRWAALLVMLLALAPFVPKYVPEAVAREQREHAQASEAGEQMKEELARLEKKEVEAIPEEVGNVVEEAGLLADQMATGDLDRLSSLEKLGQLDEEIAKARQDLSFEQVQGAFGRAAGELERAGLERELSQAMSKMDAQALEKELSDLAAELGKPTEIGKQELLRIGEAFSRMAKTLDRQGEGELSRLAESIAGDLEGERAADAAAGIEQMAESPRIGELAGDPQRSQELARALDAARETQDAVAALHEQDAAGVREALSDLARSVREGKRPSSYEERQAKTLGKALKQLSNDLASTSLTGLSKSLGEAGKALERGDTEGAAKALGDIEPGSLGRCSGLARGDSRMAELSSLVAETRALLGQGSGERQGIDMDPLGIMAGKSPRDYGVGTSATESAAGRSDSVHHDQDRTGESRSEWKERYEKKYEPLRLEGAEGAVTRVPGKITGSADYVEFRGLPGREEPTVSMGAPPSGYRRAAEDALSSEEIPPGYRDRIKSYFDDLPAPDAQRSAPVEEGREP